MEVRRYSAHQDINSSSMCDPTQRSCEPRRKRADERNAPPEMARIITDPATGKCYCRGKVLGKVVPKSRCCHCWIYSLKQIIIFNKIFFFSKKFLIFIF